MGEMSKGGQKVKINKNLKINKIISEYVEKISEIDKHLVRMVKKKERRQKLVILGMSQGIFLQNLQTEKG